MNYHRINHHDIANGEGIRVSLYVSGCERHCKGCFNSETWNKNSGKPFGKKQVDEIIKAAAPEYISGLSLLGGEPFENYNQEKLVDLVKTFKLKFPKKNVWCWTGYTFEELLKNNSILLPYIDILVDGPFEINKKDLRLKWRGSSNQRVLNVKESLPQNSPVFYIFK